MRPSRWNRGAWIWATLAAGTVLQIACTVSGAAKSPPDLRAILEQPFVAVKTWGELPADLRAALAAHWGEDSRIADPGQPFQETDVVMGKPLPWRRLVFAARSGKTCVIVYEHGGIELSSHLVVSPYGDARLGHFVLNPPAPKDVAELRARSQSKARWYFAAENY
ncbi:MAG TPA: hypothetical protein VFC23_06360 [Thermoanaerobaculia bacterium]|nr:hypothetical protein [Thermoanaerobaculia bacterium]